MISKTKVRNWELIFDELLKSMSNLKKMTKIANKNK